MKSFVPRWLLLVWFVTFAIGSINARAVSLAVAWDPSPDPTVANYNVYYTQLGTSTTNRFAAGLMTTTAVSNLLSGQAYLFYVTAVDSSGVESVPSNSLVYLVNTPPTLAPVGDQSVIAGSPLILNLSATDKDIPTQTLTFSLVSGPSGASVDPVSGVFTWTPTAAQANSTFPVTVEVTDSGSPAMSDTQSFNITVAQANTPPVLAAVASGTVVYGTPLSIQLSATDADVPAQMLTYSMLSGPTGALVNPGTGLFTWTPIQTQIGSTAITVQVTDNGTPPMSASQSFTLTVTQPNTAPVLAAVPNLTATPGVALSWQLSATDGDLPAQTLTYAVVSGPAGASVNPASGLFTWTPTSAQANTVSTIKVQVTDSGTPPLSASQSFTVAVAAVSVPPTLASIPNQSAAPGSTLAVQLVASDTKVPAPILSYSLLSGPAGAAVNPSSGLFTWTPTAAQAPSVNTVTVQVSDNGNPPLTASQSFSVTVTQPNTAPVLAAVASGSVVYGTPLSIQLSATDADVPAQMLTYTMLAGPTGALVNPGTGLFTWTPTQTQIGSTTLRVQVTDNGTPPLSASQSFTVTVTPPNTAPVLAAVPNLTATPGVALSWQLSATDGDVPAQTLTYAVVSGPAGASVNPASGLFTWTPTQTQIGSTTIKVQVTDNGTPPLSASQSFTVAVTQVANTAPVLSPISDRTASPGQIVMLALSATDADVPAQQLTYSLVSGPSGAAVDPSTGVFTWRLSKSAKAGTYPVTVSVTDSGTPPLSASQSFNVIVVTKTSRSLTGNIKPANLDSVSWMAQISSSHEVRFTTPVQANEASGAWIHYVEMSEDLVNWTSIGVASTTTEFRDSTALGAAKRFYRIRSEPVDPAVEVQPAAGDSSTQ